MVKLRLEKSGLPKIAAMIGVIRSATRAATSAPKAAPITTATARSTTLPRSRNALKSLSIIPTASPAGGKVLRLRLGSHGDRHARERAQLAVVVRELALPHPGGATPVARAAVRVHVALGGRA